MNFQWLYIIVIHLKSIIIISYNVPPPPPPLPPLLRPHQTTNITNALRSAWLSPTPSMSPPTPNPTNVYLIHISHNQYYPTRPNRLATLGSRTFETLPDAINTVSDTVKTLLRNASRCHRHSRSLQPCNLRSINHSSTKLLRRMPQQSSFAFVAIVHVSYTYVHS